MPEAERWTDERINLLKTLWAGGATAAAIAARLGGLSRSAVLGKIFRLRLGASPRSFLPLRVPARGRRGSKQRAAAPAPAPARGKGKSLLELTNTCCRWPHGRPGSRNFFFCGAPGADLERGMPYCAEHARRAYVAPGTHQTNESAAEPADVGASNPPEVPRRKYLWRSAVQHPAPRWK